ncbi:unnamed protein product [Rotaria sp. Silwood2]|nr:unnamed protein product [Rotaria sp. Silwood2]CAF4416536.1 unnamed protein product [Rotaria sp. Silwood2]CAF4435996.1 unnamed protein product [Rotaria sp. Silwood2]CAF4721399.1 unnamed protein product [Rotaria sp. Silwood2]
MTERKAFNIIKAVPGVGQAYGVVRGVVYAEKDDMHEAKHSVTVDLADLNPLRIPRNLAHGIASATNDLDEGAWIGKRPIGKQLIGLNISPGIDGLHCSYKFENERNEWYNPDCKEYSWYLIKKELPDFDPEVLRTYAKSFEVREYQALIATGDKINCQSFATRMFATSANISIEKARSTILLVVPNILF